jgi:hypothetical protein
MDDVILLLKATLPMAWCRDTAELSTQGYWSDQNPALGQSAVTALLVQDILGGEIVRSLVQGYGAHYANRLPDGRILDLTAIQFPERTDVPPGETIDRATLVEGYPPKRLDTVRRYELLVERYEQYVLRPALDDDD